ncbi:hypothetical protein [Parahaliea mediterranea]|uniref:DUF2388 domain-containing protein n=1 Tax=Parahaliea mediterranea TaxID=651086 RepID=A0A939DH05_9GAMM|nr:hypothetical protein [Parahaliea mediterranea]MBN7797965.1 hypothetical protein [Parahaliea mediterranea]
MQSIAKVIVAFLLAAASLQASALALGPDEFVAARQLTCVLAQDSLGYLSADDFSDLTEEVLADYEQADGDVIYAKALGYFDGLMFGLPESDSSQIQARLRSFLESQACTRVVGVSYTL